MLSTIENQLINKKIVIQHFDELTGCFIDLNKNNIDKYYKDVYILAKKNNSFIPSEFYNLEIDKNMYDQVISNFIIYKVSISILLKNPNNINNIIILSNTEIEQYNIFNYTLEIKNIILPILNINFNDLSIYLKQYSLSNTLDNLYKLILMNLYLETEANINSQNENIINMIDSMIETKYWSSKSNCILSINKEFNNRKILFNTCRLNNIQVADEINLLFKQPLCTENNEDYLKDIIKSEYIDISLLNNYKINNKSDMSYEHFNNLFDNISEYKQYILFTNLMISREYVHLVINNKYILEIMIKKMKPLTCLFKYLLSYSWIMLYYEECIKKTSMKTSDTFIFDIDTASLLPVYPFIHSKPNENPYMPILVSENDLFSKININGISDYNTNLKIYCNQGICNLEEFTYRMNIFCTGDYKYNLFQDFDFKKYNIAISGSIMTACLQRNHPLMNIINNTNFNEYFNDYYSKADIDVMFIANDIFTFMNNVKIFYYNICKNMLIMNNSYNDTELVLNKLAYLFVTEKFIKENITNDKIKILWIKKNIGSNNVIILFKSFYQKLKEDKYNELIKGLNEDEIKRLEKEYPDIYNKNDVELKIYINNRTINDIDLSYTYKYKITSKYLKHPLELFKVKYNDFISCVSQFHLPCVRAYYNGNVYLTPSCISSHLTYMNIDYKYVSGSTDILEIINKYRLRGFGTWLNKNEYDMMIKYCNNVIIWKKIFANNNIYGTISLNSSIFRKKNINYITINCDIVKEFNNNISYTEILKIRDNDIIINEIYNNLKVIDNDGNILPLKKWIINYSLDLLFM